MTGPQAGNYSVTLDGTVTRLAGQSQFTVCNTSLYFATGLNASVEHSLEVENEGGKLSLLENGFITFVSDLCVEGLLLCLLSLTTLLFNFTLVPTIHRQMLCPSPVGNTSMGTSHRGSIIAAFTTAGVLGFVILVAALFYRFVWKPRKQREGPHLTRPHRPGFDSPAIHRSGFTYHDWSLRRKDVRSEVRGEGVGQGGRLYPSSSTESGFATWQREAVEGCTRGVRLPVSFRRPSEGESSPSLETKHSYGRHSYFHVPISGDVLRLPLNEEIKDLKAIALANLKNKGKARQITGADSVGNSRRSETSLRSYLLQGLPFKVNVKGRSSSRSSGSINFTLPPQSPISGYPRSPGEGDQDQMSSFYAADNPSPVDLRRDDVRVSIKRWSAIPQHSTRILSPLPSVPRSVSDSNTRTITRRRSCSPRHQRESRHFLLQEDEDSEDIYTRESENQGVQYPLSAPPPHPQILQAKSNEVHEKRNTVSSLSLHQVIRSLSPRTSEREKCDNRVSYRSFSYAFSDKPDGQPSGDENRINSDEEDVMSSVHFASVVSPSVAHMPSSATAQIRTAAEKRGDVMNTIIIRGEEAQLAENDSPVLPNLRMTSPFDVNFDWRSDSRRQTRISRDVFVDANQDSKRKLFRTLSNKSQTLNVPHDFVQGTSRRAFRLTTSTLDHPLDFPFPPHSQRSSGIATSFLDFTSSSDGSARAKSSQTNLSSEERIFGEPPPPPRQSSLPELRGGGSPVLKSRWSTTTIPRDLSRSREVTPNPSSSEHSSRPNTTRTSVHSAILPSIILTSDSHSMVINSAGHRSSERLNATQVSSENPIYTTSDPESRTDSLPHTVSDTNIDDSSGSSSRRTTDSSNAFHARVLLASRYSPLPEGADEEEAITISRHLPAE